MAEGGLSVDGIRKQGIEVIERDEDGHVVGTFTFWGRMTIDMNNGGGNISINAPGHHDPTGDELCYAPEYNPSQKEIDKELFCKRQANGELNCHHDATEGK